MNTETGKVYYTQADIDAARKRGEPLAAISAGVAQIVEAGHAAINRKERRAQSKQDRRAARAGQR